MKETWKLIALMVIAVGAILGYALVPEQVYAVALHHFAMGRKVDTLLGLLAVGGADVAGECAAIHLYAVLRVVLQDGYSVSSAHGLGLDRALFR